MEETQRGWEGGWKKKKKKGISHLASQRREVGDTERPSLEPEERTKQPVRGESARERELWDAR